MLSVFDMFKIGIGPSSSHTMGPMIAAKRFAGALFAQGLDHRTAGVKVDVYGSLALTGEGHGTLNAILNGLEGKEPRTVDPNTILPRATALRNGAALILEGKKEIPFDFRLDIGVHKDKLLPKHTNGLLFTALDRSGKVLLSMELYSIGGGFVVSEDEFGKPPGGGGPACPHPYANAAELMLKCRENQLTIPQLVMANELAFCSAGEIRSGLLEIADIMHESVVTGYSRPEGTLPGGLHVKRRAPRLRAKMLELAQTNRHDIRLWPTVYAIAASEENAGGGRVVTAPTNGSAGIIPAILEYMRTAFPHSNADDVVNFLLIAGAIGMIYKMNASIAGAEVGCQGEVGVSCSMAAAGWCGFMGGSLAQIEGAAEIAMEHHLGMTCDPVLGLVQIPCIERNGIAAEEALKCAQLAYLGDGTHRISLDQVVKAMYETGKDMQGKYKETSLGGLALTAETAVC